MSLSELGVQSNSLSAMVKSWEHWLVVVCVVASLVLVYYLVMLPRGVAPLGGSVPVQGFVNYSATAIGFNGLRDDSYGAASADNPQVKGWEMPAPESMVGSEEPQFWNAGDLKVLDAYDQAAIANEGSDMNAGVQGFAARGRTYQPGYAGFKARMKKGMARKDGFASSYVTQGALDQAIAGAHY